MIKKKMDATKQHVREALYTLSRVVETEETLHIVIDLDVEVP